MQALYLCIACEEPFDVGMPIPEDAIVFDGVIVVLIGLMMQKLLLLI